MFFKKYYRGKKMISELLFNVTNINSNKRLNRCYKKNNGITQLW